MHGLMHRLGVGATPSDPPSKSIRLPILVVVNKSEVPGINSIPLSLPFLIFLSISDAPFPLYVEDSMGRGIVSRRTFTEIYHFETSSKLMAYFCLLMHAAQSTKRCHLWQE